MAGGRAFSPHLAMLTAPAREAGAGESRIRQRSASMEAYMKRKKAKAKENAMFELGSRVLKDQAGQQ